LSATTGEVASTTHSIVISNDPPPPPPPPPTGMCIEQSENESKGGYMSCNAVQPLFVSQLNEVLTMSGESTGMYEPVYGVWDEVFIDQFSAPSNADRTATLDYTRWSTRFPYGDWKNNSAAGDEGWFVNTTGLEPGQGWYYDNGDRNHFPDMDRFIVELNDASKDVYSLKDGALAIQAHTNPWKNKINGREDYLTGVISSHTDPSQDNSHGFEFTYGYAEARIKVPVDANGFRAAFWLYSDNAFNNANLGRRDPAPPIYEIDIMEYLPNTRPNGDACFTPQLDLFGGALADKTVLTYDTIFHTYHFPADSSGRNRSPDNWTFNGSADYTGARCALGEGSFNMDFSTDWVTYGVLWEPDFIEWYVNGVAVHRVVPIESDIATPLCQQANSSIDGMPLPRQCRGPIHDQRMYIMASLHMGFSFFEGSTDTSAFRTDGGPEMLIDYIRVLQRTEQGTPHARCGSGANPCEFRP